MYVCEPSKCCYNLHKQSYVCVRACVRASFLDLRETNARKAFFMHMAVLCLRILASLPLMLSFTKHLHRCLGVVATSMLFYDFSFKLSYSMSIFTRKLQFQEKSYKHNCIKLFMYVCLQVQKLYGKERDLTILLFPMRSSKCFITFLVLVLYCSFSQQRQSQLKL